MSTLNDSPLSITASIAGILTFIYAITAGVLGYAYILRSYTNTDNDIQRFYEAFSACALESDLVRQDILASHSSSHPSRAGQHGDCKFKYLLDPNSLARLYEQVRAVEIDLQKQAAKIIETKPQGGEGWLGQVLGRGRWLTRSKELEASLGKREALTARLLVVQLSLVSAKMHSQAEIMARMETQGMTNKHEIEHLRARLNEYEFSSSKDEEKDPPI
ncbi:N-acetylglucosaminyl-phosphatidylinositol de-N-acetylase [Trapelia coarctata]|nr:N-acetylglucosaminyl-phosphatidylinositol de-N-acetylase [Trapelia coarctata]